MIQGVQVGVAKADYLSLCRKHWLERMQSAGGESGLSESQLQPVGD